MNYTYSTLKASLQSWREDTNEEFVAAIPEIIGKAELQILRDLNLTIFDNALANGTTTIGDPLITKPVGMLFTRNVWITVAGKYRELFPRTKSWCLDYAPDVSVRAAPEYYYEESDLLWYVVSTPDQQYPVTAMVSIRPSPMSQSTQETWIGDNVPDLLHAGALAQACRYLKKYEEIAGLDGEYAEKLAIARLELRSLIRSDYSPVRAAGQVM